MNIYDLWFCSAKLSSKIKIELVKTFNTLEEIWYYSNCEKSNIYTKKEDEKIKFHLKKAWDKERLESLYEQIKNKNISSVNFYDNKYPKKLKNYSDSPSVIFYKGNIKKLNENLNIAIVGARNCSTYGRNVANMISKELSEHNINIISGMAKGIDSYAHRVCLESKGYTCAVLGCGVDVIYPKENKKLYNYMLEDGCIISEFLPGTQPFSYNFPMRNRIISGLSDVVIVVEAAERSGSLITASLALEQGKDVVAVPGSIFSEQSKGTNKLIRDGAYPFTNFYDLFQIFNIQYVADNKDNIKKISGLQRKIYDILTNEPIHVDDIFKRTNIDIKQLYEVLFELQLGNEILSLPGNYYVKVERRV
ncbi:DNA-protecting protein DprA [Clostridium sp. PL3]|uniref:DNA-protecting protein DprA n=1 Tax=Clostridium thailandense TaxID=2794346 RepID=A0A949U1R6_9CLOT|nr:DNA-processing protein DprA [Clostridium thailandense]MBV7274888.1 DNA-protecting protein DprA [Clostridium thailandense]